MKHILIAGGSGFLGQVLEEHFSRKGYNVTIFTRNPKKANDIFWDAKTLGPWVSSLENSEALINLTGKSVDCRYTEKNKQRILDSRIESTRILGVAINQCKFPPKVWFNSSTATIYKGSLDTEMTEDAGEIGDDFSMNIAKSWEQAFYESVHSKTRKLILRTSIVLGKHGGALIPLQKLTQFGLGGKQGSGHQKVSWIHEKDFANAVEFLLENQQLEGVFNLSVPTPTDNKTLMKTLRKIMNKPFGIAHPKWLLELGAMLIRTETELILKSRNVIPKRLLDQAFSFEYDNLEIALNHLLKSPKKTSKIY